MSNIGSQRPMDNRLEALLITPSRSVKGKFALESICISQSQFDELPLKCCILDEKSKNNISPENRFLCLFREESDTPACKRFVAFLHRKRQEDFRSPVKYKVKSKPFSKDCQIELSVLFMLGNARFTPPVFFHIKP